MPHFFRPRAASELGGEPRFRVTIPAMVVSIMVLALLPIEASHAGFLSDLFKGSSKTSSPPKSAATPKRVHSIKTIAAAAPKPQVAQQVTADPPSSRPLAPKCDPAKFRMVVDVGHTVESQGAISARNVPEFDYNLHLAQQIVDGLKAEGFTQAKLLVTTGKARPSLFKRVAAANDLHPDLFLSVHHDSVPDKMLEDWDYEGKKSRFSDRFSGYGVFVSKSNPDFAASLQFARLIGEGMRAKGFKFADQYTLPVMGKDRHELLDPAAGVYRYDQLIVLMHTNMPAALLEAGSISNRDEELQMASPERQEKTVAVVTDAVRQYCGLPPAPPTTAPDAEATAAH